MKKGKKKLLRTWSIAPGEGVVSYVALIVLGFIFAQAHRDPFSHAVLVFVAVFPLISVLCLLLTLPGVKVLGEEGSVTAIRNEKAKVSLIVKNSGIFPVNLTLEMLFPEIKGGRKLLTVKKRVCLAPLTKTVVSSEILCGRIGSFDVGIKSMVAYDLMHILRIRRKCEELSSLVVLPSCDGLANVDDITSDDGENAEALLDGRHSDGYTDIREYRPGDGMKNIHWKLSTKTEELQAKKYSNEENKHLVIKCSGAFSLPHGMTEGEKCEIEDRVIEEAFSAVSDALSKRMRGDLIIELGNSLKCISFSEDEDAYDVALKLAALTDSSCYQNDGADIKMINAVHIIPFINNAQARDAYERALVNSTAIESIVICDMADVAGRVSAHYQNELDGFISFLENSGAPYLCSKREG